METESSPSKIDAIYQLREAVEAKAHAEHELAANASAAARDALLEAQLDVEAKTQDAIEVCNECGHEHASTAGHVSGSRVSGRYDNVIEVDFGRGSESA